jgi:hypothetical protein
MTSVSKHPLLHHEVSQPISRVLSRTVIYLGLLSPTTSSSLPELLARTVRALRREFLFGLAPSGVYRAIIVTNNAVRSYRTLSPLPAINCLGGLLSAALAVDINIPPRSYLAPCPMEPGLSSTI